MSIACFGRLFDSHRQCKGRKSPLRLKASAQAQHSHCFRRSPCRSPIAVMGSSSSRTLKDETAQASMREQAEKRPKSTHRGATMSSSPTEKRLKVKSARGAVPGPSKLPVSTAHRSPQPRTEKNPKGVHRDVNTPPSSADEEMQIDDASQCATMPVEKKNEESAHHPPVPTHAAVRASGSGRSRIHLQVSGHALHRPSDRPRLVAAHLCSPSATCRQTRHPLHGC